MKHSTSPRILLGPRPRLQRVRPGTLAMAPTNSHGGRPQGPRTTDRSVHGCNASSLPQVLWCRRTWLEYTGNTFCQVGRTRVNKAETECQTLSDTWRAQNNFNRFINTSIPESWPCQDTLLLPILATERICHVMLCHNRGLGPNFRPSRNVKPQRRLQKREAIRVKHRKDILPCLCVQSFLERLFRLPTTYHDTARPLLSQTPNKNNFLDLQ